MSLPERSLLHFGRLYDRVAEAPHYARAIYTRVREHALRFEYPPSHLAMLLSTACDSTPRTSEERYLLSLAIASIREHETRLRKARTTLAEMRVRAACEAEAQR